MNMSITFIERPTLKDTENPNYCGGPSDDTFNVSLLKVCNAMHESMDTSIMCVLLCNRFVEYFY